MKVERKQKEEWVPIVITLETKEEAQLLWHCLNMSRVDLDRVAKRQSLYVPYPGDGTSPMFDAIDQYRDELK